MCACVCVCVRVCVRVCVCVCVCFFDVCCVLCRSLRLGEEDQEVAAMKVTNLGQGDSTKHVFHFEILAK